MQQINEIRQFSLPRFDVLTISNTPPASIPYGVHMIGAPLEWPETEGEGVRVLVIDTGAPQHPDIKVAGQVDFTGEGPEDVRGHATHVCGIIAANGKIKGVAPKVTLYTAKVFPRTGGANRNAIVAALDWARANNMDVVNMSFGGPTSDALVETACQRCIDAGILLVAACGNFGNDFPHMYPAEYPSVLSVSAVDVDKLHGDFSSRGEGVELTAAGVQVYSTWLSSTYALLDGTSMAAPHITGAAAILVAKRRHRGLSCRPEFLRDVMATYTEDLGERGRDRKYGYGLFSFGRVEGGQPVPDRPANRLELKIGQAQYWHNGQLKAGDAPPVIINGRTMVPVRLVSEGLGAKVHWIPPDAVVVEG